MTKLEDLRNRAEAGDADAQLQLGVCYANGIGINHATGAMVESGSQTGTRLGAV